MEDSTADEQIQSALFGSKINQYSEHLQKILRHQAFPPLLIERILNALPIFTEGQQTQALSQALDKILEFSALSLNASKRAFMLVGPCGCGKTIAVAKMAVKAKINGKKITVITTDVKRAGAIEQLEAFTKILEVDLIKVRKPDLLKKFIDENRLYSDLILIDTPGVNPFLKSDMDFLSDLLKDTDGLEPILVLSAGQDAYESAEIADIFRRLGCHRILATRLDLSRRLGNILWAAISNGYALTDVGISAHVSEGLCPLKAKSLAELLLLETRKEVV